MSDVAKKIDGNFTELNQKKTDNSADSQFLGNAASTTKLKTERAISLSGDVTGTVKFDGSKDVGIASTLASVTQTNTTSNETATAGGNVTVIDKITVDAKGRTSGVNTKTVTLPATQTSVTGNAGSATKLQNTRSLALSGDGTGSSNFDGTSNVSIPLTLSSVTRADTVSSQNGTAGSNVALVDSVKTDTKGRLTGVNVKSLTLPPVQTSVSGNAGTATKLATARTIGGVSFDGSANIDLAGVNKAGNQNTSGNAGSATKLATSRTINGVGFDGTANITLTANPSITNLPVDVDLNTVKTAGFYTVMKSDGAINKPEGAAGSWFTLLVQNIGTANVSQIYFDTNTAQLFIRKLSSSIDWGKWIAISDGNGLILDTVAVNNKANWFQGTALETWNTTQLYGKYYIPAWQWLANRPYDSGAYMVEVSGNYNQWLQEARSFDYTKKALYRTFDGSYWTEWRGYQ